MLDYKTFMSHAKKVCNSPHLKGKEGRFKNLIGILHEKDGSLICTDAHRLYIGKNLHGKKERVVITPNGEVLGEDFPDVSRLIPNKLNANQMIKVDVKSFVELLDMTQAIAKLTDTSTVQFAGNQLVFQSVDIKVRHEIPFQLEEKTAFNVFYLFDAFNLFKAAKLNEVAFYYYGKLRPLLIGNEDDSLLALVLPVRTV